MQLRIAEAAVYRGLRSAVGRSVTRRAATASARRCHRLLDRTMKDEEPVRVWLVIREIEGSPSSDLDPEVVLQVVHRKLLECVKPPRERVVSIRLVVNPFEARNKGTCAISEPVLVDHRDTLVKLRDRKGHIQLGYRIANLHVLAESVVPWCRDVHAMWPGRNIDRLERGHANIRPVDEDVGTRTVAPA
jgi:hypothetical protein